MTEYLDLLERASERGEPRGIDRVMQSATGRVRRRRRQHLAAIAAVALAMVGVAGWGAADRDDTTTIAASDPSNFVAFMPDSDDFDVVVADDPRRYADIDPQHDAAPAAEFGRLTVFQQLDQEGKVRAGLAIGVSNENEQQSTLLDMFPLAEGSVEGQSGSYPMGNSSATAGLTIVERQSASHTIRVAGRGLDTYALVETLESVTLGPDGDIQDITLPETLPTAPVYDGPDASRIGRQPALTTTATYEDRDTGQDLTILTTRDETLVPAAALAWLFDGTVRTDLTQDTVIGTYFVGGDHAAHWNIGTLGSVTVLSARPLTIEAISELQDAGHLVDGQPWSETVRGHPGRTDTTTVDTTTTTTTEP